MSASRLLLLATCFIALGAIGRPARAADSLRVMTFNVRYGEAKDGINAWPKRRDLMVQVIRSEHPDILGTQELLSPQGDYLQQHLPGYKWFGMGRNGNEIFEVTRQDDGRQAGWVKNGTRLQAYCKKTGGGKGNDEPEPRFCHVFCSFFPVPATPAAFRPLSA